VGPALTGRRPPGTTPDNGMGGAVPGDFALVAVEGGRTDLVTSVGELVLLNGRPHLVRI
jgi:hypothetical protein